jgi:YD repeat-containing protein
VRLGGEVDAGHPRHPDVAENPLAGPFGELPERVGAGGGPDGGTIHYVRTSPGTGYADAVFEHTTTPGPFYQSRMVWNGDGWDLTLKDGTVYVFGDPEPLQAIRDRFGNTVQLTWDAANERVTKVTSPTGRFIEFTYDGFDRITQAKDNIGRTVGYEYDAAGRLWMVTDARGGVTEYSYDIAHRLLTIEDPRNIVYLENEYDTSGRVIRQTQADGGEYESAYTVNGSGQITQTDVTDPRGVVRRVTFNGDGYHTADIAALGESIEQSTTYTRLTGSHLVESETDALGRVTRYTYDSRGNGRLWKVTDARGGVTATPGPLRRTAPPTTGGAHTGASSQSRTGGWRYPRGGRSGSAPAG